MSGKDAQPWHHLAVATVRYRLAAGITQKELADRLGVSRSAIGNFEAGVSTLHPRALQDLHFLVFGPATIIGELCLNMAYRQFSFAYTAEQKRDMWLDFLTEQIKSLSVHVEGFDEVARLRQLKAEDGEGR